MKPGNKVRLLGISRNVDKPDLIGQTAIVVKVDELWTLLDFGDNSKFFMHKGNGFIDEPLVGNTGWWWRTDYLEIVE